MAISGPKAPQRWDSALTVFIGGADLLVDSSGVTFWPAHGHAAGLRLHLEKGSAYSRRGVFLPPYDTRETLIRLAKAVTLYEVRRVIALGDSFHSSHAADGLDAEAVAQIAALQTGREWVWIAGNHDRPIPRRVGGDFCDEMILDGIALRHMPVASTGSGEVAGHLHPVARLALNGSVIRRRCFVSDASRIILPAFGALAGGLNILDKAFQ